MRFMKRRPLEDSLRTLLELEAEAEGTASVFLPVIFLGFLTFHVFVVICNNRLLDELFSVMLERLKNLSCRLKRLTSLKYHLTPAQSRSTKASLTSHP